MTEVLVAAVTAAGLLAVALISNRGRQHAKATREQVQNAHPTNLRDDIDHLKDQNDQILDRLDGHERRLERIERRRLRRFIR